MGISHSKAQKKRRNAMSRGNGYGLYGPRGEGNRRDDRWMPRGYLENRGMIPGFVPGGFSPRNANPMFVNPRLTQTSPNQGQVSSPSIDQVKKWVMETCGTQLEEATGSLKIRGFPDDIPQFVVHKPETQLQMAFKHRKSMYGGSKLVFHGTPLPNLPPILQGGFKGGMDGSVWVAREPMVSVGYALKGISMGGRARGFPQLERPLESPYVAYGALLGCEFAENKRFRGRRIVVDRSGAAASTSDHHAVMVRYVFLVPPEVEGARSLINTGPMRPWPRTTVPTRFQIRDQMKENMEKIEARIEERRRGG